MYTFFFRYIYVQWRILTTAFWYLTQGLLSARHSSSRTPYASGIHVVSAPSLDFGPGLFQNPDANHRHQAINNSVFKLLNALWIDFYLHPTRWYENTQMCPIPYQKEEEDEPFPRHIFIQYRSNVTFTLKKMGELDESNAYRGTTMKA
jgi:hypothetical protein